MRFQKLDLNLLVALDAMLEEGNISRAAERLHMSQSAMSGALARLREYFDDPLLVQVGRKLEMTPRAALLRDAVRDVLVRVDTTIAARPQFDPATADREFTVLVSDYTLSTLGRHLVGLVHEQSHTVRLRLMPQMDMPQRALERGEADMLVIPKTYCSAEHPTEVLWQEHFVCGVCERGAHGRRALTFDRYTAAGHVVVEPANQTNSSFESWFMQRYGVQRRVEVVTHSFSSLLQLVVGTDRIATVQTRLARLAQQTLPVRLLPPPMAIPTMDQVLQWHKYRTLDPGLVWLRGLMHQAVQRMDAELARLPERPGVEALV